ncbi:MAG TPA: FtsX-like permease family protein [Anaeromyxobacteraceae bacterium]|nr:FtsX-like permease family protein [Anaeromyxobacteraceae bacterium]
MASLLRHAPVRALRRSPALTALMVATLAFGLAVWLTAHSVVWSLERDPMRDVAGLWRVELVRHPELRDILRGTDMASSAELPQMVLSPAEVESLSRSGVPARTAAVTSGELPIEAHDGRPAIAAAIFVDGDAFSLFAIRLAAGRPFEEGRRELLLSERDATARFGGAAGALARDVVVAGETWRVAGVVASGAAEGRRLHVADRPADPVLWMPFPAALRLGVLPARRHPAPRTGPATGPNGDFAFASLWLELADADAVSRMRAWLGAWAAAHPGAGAPRLRRYQEWSGVLGSPPAYRVLELLGALTLGACSLTLARLFHTRQRLHQLDVALRRALGATRTALLRDALVEGAAIAAGGVVAGLLLAAGALQLLDAAVPVQGASLALKGSRVAFGVLVGVGVGLAAALVPAWRISAEPPARALRGAP